MSFGNEGSINPCIIVTIIIIIVIIIIIIISYVNRTEWTPIRSVIIRMITKSDDRAAGVRFVYHEYDHRPNCTTRINHKITISEKRRIPKYEKGKFTLNVFYTVCIVIKTKVVIG